MYFYLNGLNIRMAPINFLEKLSQNCRLSKRRFFFSCIFETRYRRKAQGSVSPPPFSIPPPTSLPTVVSFVKKYAIEVFQAKNIILFGPFLAYKWLMKMFLLRTLNTTRSYIMDFQKKTFSYILNTASHTVLFSITKPTFGHI